jgi:hypothetical protein
MVEIIHHALGVLIAEAVIALVRFLTTHRIGVTVTIKRRRRTESCRTPDTGQPPLKGGACPSG